MADVTGKIVTIKAELKAATNEAQQLGFQLANMRESANALDSGQIAKLEKDFQLATQRASQLKDQINNTNEQIGILTAGSKFEVMGNGIKDVAGKIASMDFEGAAESANRLVKLSKSISFGDAVKGIKDIGSTFLSLGKALLTNPLFLIAGAIALAVTYSKELLTLIDGVSGKDEERLKTLTKQAEASKAQLDSIGAQEETLKRNGLSEEEILQLKINAAKVAAADAKAQLEQQKTIRDNQIKASERNAKILSGVLQFITAPLQVLLLGVDKFTEALKNAGIISEETFATVGGLRDKFNEGVTSLVFDPKKVKEEGDEAVKKAEKAAIELQNTLDGYENKKDANAKARADKIAAEQAKENEAFIKSQEENSDIIAKLEEQNAADEQSALEAKNKAEYDANQARLKQQEDYYAVKQQLITDDKEKEIDAVVTKYDELFGLANGNAELEKQLTEQQNSEIAAIDKKYTEINKEKTDEEIALDEQKAMKKVRLAADAFGALGDLANAFVSGDEKNAKKAFEVNKAFSLGSAIANTGLAVTGALTAGGNPIKLATGTQFVEAGVAAAVGLANITKIAKSKFSASQSASGGGGSTGGGASASFGAAAPITPSFSLFGQGNQLNNVGGTQTTNGNQSQALAVNVSISETEITKKQNFATKVQESATL